MAKLNKVFLFFHPSQSNEYFIYNTDNDFKSDKNIFRYFDSKTDNTLRKCRILMSFKIKIMGRKKKVKMRRKKL